LFIYGGTDVWREDDCLYTLNTITNEWAEVPIRHGGWCPNAREDMSMFSFEDKLYLFGGEKEGACHNDFHEFSIKTHCWEELSTYPTNNWFSPRCSLSTTCVSTNLGMGQCVYFIGGRDENGVFPDHIAKITFSTPDLIVWWLLHLFECTELT